MPTRAPRSTQDADAPADAPAAADFDEPMSMLHACHDRLRHPLSMLLDIGERVAASQVDAHTHGAAAAVLHHCDRAAPQHHEDEERHVFACLLAREMARRRVARRP